MHMLFEVQDLKVASPATVSRCGMVYMEQVHVGMSSLVRTWGSVTLKEIVGLRNANRIVGVIEEHLDATIDFLRYECKEKMPSSNNQSTQMLLNLFTSMLTAENRVTEDSAKILAEEVDLMNALLVWSFAWSLGANIHDNSRNKFDEFMKENLPPLLAASMPYSCSKISITFMSIYRRRV